MPTHQWLGTKLQFELPSGEWGEAVDLRGPAGASIGNGIWNGGAPAFILDAPIDGNPYWRKDGSWQIAITGGSATWGAIVGDLADQDDLSAALGLKVDSSSLAAIATSGDIGDLTGFPGGTTTYLRADGTFATPPGGGGGSVAWGEVTGDLSDQTDLQAALDAKADSAELAAVAISGAYNDLTGRPSLGTAAAHAATDFATAAQGATADSAVQPGSLATVATSGAYSDLTGKPSLAAVATSGAYSDLTGKPSLATVATTGAYGDLTGTPSLAAVATSGSAADLTTGQLADARVKASNVTQHQASLAIAWSQLTSLPTTLAGYGITDAESSSHASSTYATIVNLALKAPIASPTFTGTPAAPTATSSDNSTQLATTAFVKAQSYAPLASPTFTGTPAAPTATAGTNTTQVATTAFVTAAVAAGGGGGAATWGSITGTLSSQTDLNTALGLKAPLASPALTGTPTAPTASAGTNNTQIATTAFVAAALPSGPVLASGTAVDVNTTTTETTIATAPIPAGGLGTDNAYDLEILGDYLNNGGGTSTIQLAVKYGSTTLWLDVTTAQTAVATVRHPFYMKVRLAGAHSANAQVVGGIVVLGTASAATTGTGDLAQIITNATGSHSSFAGSAAENSATALNLVVTVKHSLSNALTSFRALHVACTAVGGVGATGAQGPTGASGAGTGQVPPATGQTASFSTTSAQIDHETLCTHATTPIVVTITAASFAADGAMMSFRQGGAAAVSFVGGSGITIKSSATSVATPMLRKLWSACSARLDTVAGGVVYMDGDFQ
jgi:hypothetical protein